MRKFLGAWLCLALGAVLITTGLSTSTTGTVGGAPPPCAPTEIGVANPCPTGVVTVNETTTSEEPGIAAAVTPPATWTVHVTSTCVDPSTGQPVDQTLNVPNNASATSQPLYAFTDTTDNTKCTYTLAEDAVAGYTTSWDPSNTFTFNVDGGIATNVVVGLTNAAIAATTTASAPPSKTPTKTATPTRTVTRSSTPTKTPSSAAASSVLAQTGPRERTDTTLLLGIAVFALGLLLLIAGSIGRRRGQHLG